MLMEQKIDISASPALMKPNRVEIIDYFIPIWPFRFAILKIS